MSTLELELLNAGEKQPKYSAFDYVTRLTLPGLSLVALIVTRNIQPALSWPLGAFAFASFVVGLHRPIADALRNWAGRREDRRVAREAFPVLRKFAHRFEDFIGSHTLTLHYIAQSDVCQGYGQRYNALGLPDISVWHAYWIHLTKRLDRMDRKKQQSIAELRHELLAFVDLVGTYRNSCVGVLFERLPQSERDTLTPQAKSSLNAFQQQFQRFTDEYRDFAKGLAEKRPALCDVPFNLNPLKPIS